jgi:hypothetical protein
LSVGRTQCEIGVCVLFAAQYLAVNSARAYWCLEVEIHCFEYVLGGGLLFLAIGFNCSTVHVPWNRDICEFRTGFKESTAWLLPYSGIACLQAISAGCEVDGSC